MGNVTSWVILMGYLTSFSQKTDQLITIPSTLEVWQKSVYELSNFVTSYCLSKGPSPFRES